MKPLRDFSPNSMMVNDSESALLISGIQNFTYCKRRWALVHIEQMWEENALTYEGQYMHERVHDSDFTEKRGRILLSRGMPVASVTLGITGVCDMVELEENANGVHINGRPGKYLVYPVEYKHGKPDNSGADELQLCAQAVCLEEMLCISIPEGAVYYGELRHRVTVELNEILRKKLNETVKEMHEYMNRQYTPKVKRKKSCANCSMKDVCFSKLLNGRSASAYIAENLKE